MLKFLLLLLSPYALLATLIDDLQVAAYWDRKMTESLPVTFNHLLSSGYFVTHSARMTRTGDVSVGGAHAPPYDHLNVRFQPFSHLELSANYRFFRGVEDRGLSPHGFGCYADRGANVKLALATPEQTGNRFPGIAVGIDDFMGSKKFTTAYVVGTQVLINYGLELSLGWGGGRYAHGPTCGFFGGGLWFPFFDCDNRWTKGVGLALEVDPIHYKKDPHPKGRTSAFPLNAGIHYLFSDMIDVSASWLRGKEFAAAGAIRCSLGSCTGFLPKLRDPPVYLGPEDHRCLGLERETLALIDALGAAFEEQGFCLTKASLDKGHLWISLINLCYRFEGQARCRFQHVLAALIPQNIVTVTVVVESYGLPCQQYVYCHDLLFRYEHDQIGPFEFDLLTPRCEATPPPAPLCYYKRKHFYRFGLSPRFETFLGSRKGKFKYDLGLKGNCEGFLPYDIFYEAQLSYTAISTIKGLSDFDFYNPSQLPNVLTDYVNYRKAHTVTTDKLYLQKMWNLRRGWFVAASGGYFQVNYAGISGELLWYPVCSYFALGIEGALLKKRRYTGLGFQDKLRKLKGYHPTFIPYTTLQQTFLSLYLDIPEWNLAGKVSAGRFLAGDLGFRFEATRTFESGVRVGGWITVTNAYDKVHGENYYNKGIAIEFPLDLFLRKSCRKVWNYGMAAWLRDAGAFIPTGKSLFEIVNRERRR